MGERIVHDLIRRGRAVDSRRGGEKRFMSQIPAKPPRRHHVMSASGWPRFLKFPALDRSSDLHAGRLLSIDARHDFWCRLLHRHEFACGNGASREAPLRESSRLSLPWASSARASISFTRQQSWLASN